MRFSLKRTVYILAVTAVVSFVVLQIVGISGRQKEIRSQRETDESGVEFYHPGKQQQKLISKQQTARASDRWAPLVMDECAPGLPPFAAPCLQASLNATNLEKGIELIYRPFKLAVPLFPTNQHRLDWTTALTNQHDYDRGILADGWVRYPTQYGQIFHLTDAEYLGDPPADSWSSKGCMAGETGFKSMLRFNNDQADLGKNKKQATKKETEKADKEIRQVDLLVLATSPDSWSFQHFLDRVTNTWQQSLIGLSSEQVSKATVLSGSSPQQSVKEMYDIMGVVSHLHDPYVPIKARKLVFSCRTPLIHPFIYQRVSESFHVNLYGIPVETRKTVLYLARGTGDELNGGRVVLNEKELLKELENLLGKRGLNEKLVIFDRSKFKSTADLMSFMNNNVRAVIGPHGSAFHNARFASAGTLIVEFMPKKRFQVCFWEQARLLDQQYVAYMADSENASHDMVIQDIPALMAVIDKNLGQPLDNGNIQDDYMWKMGP